VTRRHDRNPITLTIQAMRWLVRRTKWYQILAMYAALIALFMILLELTTGGSFRQFLDLRETKQPTLADQTKQLVHQLTQAIEAISTIEEEIEERQALVENLEKRRELAEKIVALNQEEVDAVAALLTEPIQREARRAFWLDVVKDAVIAIVSFVAGMLVNQRRIGTRQ
jgi:hypothetical protein